VGIKLTVASAALKKEQPVAGLTRGERGERRKEKGKGEKGRKERKEEES